MRSLHYAFHSCIRMTSWSWKKTLCDMPRASNSINVLACSIDLLAWPRVFGGGNLEIASPSCTPYTWKASGLELWVIFSELCATSRDGGLSFWATWAFQALAAQAQEYIVDRNLCSRPDLVIRRLLFWDCLHHIGWIGALVALGLLWHLGDCS